MFRSFAGMIRIRFKGFVSVPIALAPWRALLFEHSPGGLPLGKVLEDTRRTSCRPMATGGTPLGTKLSCLKFADKTRKIGKKRPPLRLFNRGFVIKFMGRRDVAAKCAPRYFFSQCYRLRTSGRFCLIRLLTFK